MREVKMSNFDFSNFNDRSSFSFSNVCYAHFNVGEGQATVVGGLKNGTVYYGVSLCSPEDNFNKANGRNLAREHFINNSNMRSAISGDFSSISPPKVLLKALVQFLSGKRHLPRWVKNAEVSIRGSYKGNDNE